MKEKLPTGRLRVYQLQHVMNPESWFKNHSRHNWEFHLTNLKRLQELLPGSCYEHRDPHQNILCQIEDFQLIGDLVVTKTKVLSADNILFDIEEGKIRATVEGEDETQEVFFYSTLDSSWKNRPPAQRQNGGTQVEILKIQTKLMRQNNEADEWLRESALRREQFKNYEPEEVEVLEQNPD
jgi:hypothetical protein